MGFGAVCISSQDGAGADEISKGVGEALGFQLINEDIVARAAVEAGVDRDVVADVERRKSFVTKILVGLGPAALSTGGVLMAPDDGLYGQIPSGHLRGFIRSVIEETAARGNVVIVSHAASLALSARDNVLRVLLIASPEKRQRRLADSLQVDEKEAGRLIKRSDAGRADYIKRFYGIDAEQPSHYDLVINTDKLRPDHATRLIVSAASAEA